jgi:cysteinyl-tRNA synthetase
MELKIHNNLTRTREDFIPIKPGHVGFYSCGPTTYDFLHVGNARALVVGDIIHRVLKYLDYEVTFVRNFTDVDDKIIERANENKEDPLALAARFVEECRKDMDSLGMLPATHTPKVSETMDEIIKMIEDIINNGAGYVIDGEVFFNVKKADKYGKLSKKDLDGLQAGQRVEVDKRKINSSDFVLWKPAKDGEPFWESPWGKGRPGWHIECSAMAKKFLGNTLDIHHGGVDLMFPHHENEIAQSEAATGQKFCNCWVHNEFLNFGSDKMSKSLGNVVTIRKFVEKFGGAVLRMILVSNHYRSRIDWTDEVINRSISDVSRIHTFMMELDDKIARGDDHHQEDQTFIDRSDAETQNRCDMYLGFFRDGLKHDFGTPIALSHMFEFLRECRHSFWDMNTDSVASLQLIKSTMLKMNEALGIIFPDPKAVLEQIERSKGKGEIDVDWVNGLIEERKTAKATKNWKRADEIRDELKAKNIVLVDNKDGTINWKMQ